MYRRLFFLQEAAVKLHRQFLLNQQVSQHLLLKFLCPWNRDSLRFLYEISCGCIFFVIICSILFSFSKKLFNFGILFHLQAFKNFCCKFRIIFIHRTSAFVHIKRFVPYKCTFYCRTVSYTCIHN